MGKTDPVTRLYKGKVGGIPDQQLRDRALARFSPHEYVIITETRKGLNSKINIRRFTSGKFSHVCPYCCKEQPSAPSEEKYLCVSCGKLVVKNLKEPRNE